MAFKPWEPGKSGYGEWLKTLTPEEKEQHMYERKAKKSMRKAYEQVILAQQEQWLARINQGVLSVLDKAIATGDAASLIAVYDRIIGKPVDTINSDTNLILPWNDSDTQSTTTDNQ